MNARSGAGPGSAVADRSPAGDRLARLFRVRDWWSSKLPPLLGFAYLLLAGPPAVDAAPGTATLALFLATAVATAAWGHFLNDFADAVPDARLGHRTPAAELPRARAALLAAAGLAVAVVPWIFLPRSRAASIAFALEVALLAAYALPPLRLKERGRASLLVDALYGHALPMAITLFVFGALGVRPIEGAALALLLGWKLAQGLCGALASQLADRHRDRRAGARTWLVAGGALAARRILLRLLLPAQLLLFVGALVALAPRSPWPLAAYLVFLLLRLAQIHFVWRKRASYWRRGYPGYSLLNDFHERWLPLVTLALLVQADPRYLVVALAHLALFRNGAGDLIRALAFGRGR